MGLNKRLINTEVSAEAITPSSYYNGVAYTGNSSNPRDISVGFQPDILWVKARESGPFNIYDSIRGTSYRILPYYPSLGQNSTGSAISAFQSDGFQLNDTSFNYIGEAMMTYSWKIGGTLDSNNTNGNIQSTTLANNTIGMSIVQWTSDGAASVKTIGHGLNQAPDMVIFKNIDNSSLFFVYHKDVGTGSYLQLNSNSLTTSWGSDPFVITSSTIGIRQSSIASNNERCIAHCFYGIPGYSAFGTYQGNNPNTVNVTVGFEPRFVMTKSISSFGFSWAIVDSVRGYEQSYINLLGAEDNFSSNTEFFTISNGSNGFSTSGNNSQFNYNGANYIYMAFA